ncbi:hypothetical protein Pmani_020908 [Petrolisthes manimaculis]|uniref:Colmedin n=1 Tax=Petrolisthes manimaculis TaxID=1843537 RepID=A0AAE1PHB9_9EUCA|nr:hypothetical protein Pmani_020908 [Petrolisthes manimaculis]
MFILYHFHAFKNEATYNAIKEFCARTKDTCQPGPIGPEGPMGPMGPLGDQGPSGDTGERGDRGLPGLKGDLGPKGLRGDPGPLGPRGPKGEMGNQGISGLDGRPGLDGRDGLPGEPGLDGVPGRNGLDGLSGTDGIPGINGAPGRNGQSGLDGIPGMKGDKGDSGREGDRGISGQRGRRGRKGDGGRPGRNGVSLWAVNSTEYKDTMSVLVEPSILGSAERGSIIVQEGDNLRLECNSAGVPPPKVQWTLDNSSPFPTGRWKDVAVSGPKLHFVNVSREHTGAYQCEARNGVNESDYRDFYVEVHFEPFIRVSPVKITAHIGTQARLQCQVEAFPMAVTYWEAQRARILENSTKYTISHQHNTNFVWKSTMSLTIYNVEKTDFGHYDCVARNEMAMTRGRVALEESSRHHRPTTGTESSLTFGHPAPSYEGFDDLCPTCPYCQKCSEGRGALFAPSYRTFGNKTVTRKEARLITAVGKPVFHRHTNNNYGSWMRDTNNETDPRYWTTDPNHNDILKEFADKNDFRNNGRSITYQLPTPFEGNSHVIFNGSFYYHVKGHPNITRLDLNTRKTTTMELPGMVYSDDRFLYNNSRDYADLSADTEGLWAIYSTSYPNNTVVVKMNNMTLKIEKGWDMTLNNNLYGNFFMAYGVLYVLDSTTDRDTRIRIAFDLYKGEMEDVDLSFNNPFSYTTLLGYNYKAKILFSWDKGNLLTYPVRESGMDTGPPGSDYEDHGHSSS